MNDLHSGKKRHPAAVARQSAAVTIADVQGRADSRRLPINKVVIPVAAGRNLAVLVEAAVRNTILKMRGIDTLADFMTRQREAMDKA